MNHDAGRPTGLTKRRAKMRKAIHASLESVGDLALAGDPDAQMTLLSLVAHAPRFHRYTELYDAEALS